MSFTRVAALDRRKLQLLQIWAQVAAIVAGLVVPMLLLTNNASALQLTSRSLQVGTSKITTASTWTYSFTTPATTNIGSLEFEVCTTPLGACTSPGAGLDVNVGATALGTGWTSANAFTRNGTGASGCTAAANVLCTARVTTASETLGARTLTQTLQVNPTAVGTFFVRITTYTDTAWVTPQDTGVVAAATVNQLTVNARIQEILNFCVGTTTVNDATTDPTSGPNNDCASISGTTVDIGVLDSSAINLSPVNINGGTNTNGIAMVRTNAQSGAVITYFTEQNNGSGTLKVAGAPCNSIVPGTGDTTDQCINSDATQTAIVAGTEEFGMTIAGTNCGSTTSYTCAYASGTNNLEPTGQYIGAAANAYGTTNGYAWNSSVTAATIATSAGSAVKVIDDEALILRFAATPQITTPTGAYTTTSTYIATATY